MIDFKYMVYVTDSIKLYAEQKAYTHRWVDSFTQRAADTRTGDEVAADVIAELGLTVHIG